MQAASCATELARLNSSNKIRIKTLLQKRDKPPFTAECWWATARATERDADREETGRTSCPGAKDETLDFLGPPSLTGTQIDTSVYTRAYVWMSHQGQLAATASSLIAFTVSQARQSKPCLVAKESSSTPKRLALQPRVSLPGFSSSRQSAPNKTFLSKWSKKSCVASSSSSLVISR